MKKNLTPLFVVLFVTISLSLTSCGGSRQPAEEKTELPTTATAAATAAEKMFASVESVKEGLTSECIFLSKDGKCIAFFFEDEVEIDEVDEQGEMKELFKSDDCRVATNNKGEAYVQIGDRAEFSPRELIIFGGRTYTNFDLYSAGEIERMGIDL